MKKTTSLTLTGVAIALLIGCSAEKVDLGNDEPPDEAQASLLAYAGDWVGYAEAYKFSDGSDRVRIVIDQEGKGSVEFGDSPRPPQPDANRGFPTSGPHSPVTIWPGFAYPLLEARVEDSRLRLESDTLQLYDGWCSLFTPVLIEPSQHYACHYAVYHSTQINEQECLTGPQLDTPVQCDVKYCNAVCKCDSESCGVNEGTSPLGFDGALEHDGKKLTGTLVRGDLRLVVRLTRK